MEITNRLVFHARTGGDLEGESFREDGNTAVFFATSAGAAELYAEHAFAVDYEGSDDMSTFDEDLLAAAPVIFPVRLTLENPAILDRDFLRQIGYELGVEISDLTSFANDFEDSVPDPRDQVFAWLRDAGYDGAYLPRDSMPLAPCGDLCLRESFVSFYPRSQVRFALALQGEESCNWSAKKDSEQEAMALDYGEDEGDEPFVPSELYRKPAARLRR
jgi:hypothetical protein